MPFVTIYDNYQKKCLLKDRQDAITNIVDIGYNIIDDNLCDKDNNDMNNYVKFKKRYECEDKELLKKLNKNVELLLMNKC